MREANKALHRTKRHVETIQEIRHKLQGATRFSEMDMGHGYHQIGLAEDLRYIGTFQTHEGLHRFKVLFFGASPATELFHDRVKAALTDLPGCTSIHDNILVWGRTPEEHKANLDACLTHLEEVSPLEEKNAPSEQPQCPGLAPFSPSPACRRTLKRSKLSRKQDHPRMQTKSRVFSKPANLMPASCTTQRKHMLR